MAFPYDLLYGWFLRYLSIRIIIDQPNPSILLLLLAYQLDSCLSCAIRVLDVIEDCSSYTAIAVGFAALQNQIISLLQKTLAWNIFRRISRMVETEQKKLPYPRAPIYALRETGF